MAMRLANLIEVRDPAAGDRRDAGDPVRRASGHGAGRRDPLVRGHRRSATAFRSAATPSPAEEIVRFGKLYDPQYFHVDPEAAKHSHFGGLVASRLAHRDDRAPQDGRCHLRRGGAHPRRPARSPGVSGPSPGVNKMEFKAPVRPGDTVTYVLGVTGKRNSNSIPGWGLLFNELVATNQRGELVYRAELVSFTKLRDYKPPLGEKIAMALTKVPLLRRLVRR